MTRKKPVSRRDFLFDGAKLALSVPFLPTLFSFEAEAGLSIRPRLITLHSVNGQLQSHWAPLQPATTLFAGGREKPLSDFASTGISRTLGTEFTPYLNKMTFIQGLDHVYGMGHNDKAILGAYPLEKPIPSLDQFLAKNAAYNGGIPVVDSLLFGKPTSWDYSGTSYVRLPTYTSVIGPYERVFGLGNQSALQTHSGILERTLAINAKLAQNSKLGTKDKQLLEAHGTLLSELRGRISKMSPLACPGAPPAKPTVEWHGNYTGAIEAAIDLIISAFHCGATKVATIGLDDNTMGGVIGDWHSTSHVPDDSLLTVNKKIANQFFLRLISRLDSIPEGSGTMLDNTLVYWGNEITNGPSHAAENLPVVLAGSAGGRLRTGYLYDYRQHDNPEMAPTIGEPASLLGRPYNQLLVTMLQAMGVTPGEYEKNGIKGYGRNTNGNPDIDRRYTKFMPEIGSPLPRLWKG